MSLKSMETDAEVAMTYLLNIKNQRVDKTASLNWTQEMNKRERVYQEKNDHPDLPALLIPENLVQISANSSVNAFKREQSSLFGMHFDQ